LSITKAYVELLGGKIWLDSEPGKGSVFYFTIPYEPLGISLPATQTFEETSIALATQGKTILVAEDENFNFLLIKELLSDEGIHILYAENGLQAVEMCKERKDIDLVLMDIKMPIMDGMEATKHIKQFNPKLVIIAVTAYAYEVDRKRLIDFGCDDYLAKPLKKKELILALNKYL
jgi:CheY-like chemotaxis protein